MDIKKLDLIEKQLDEISEISNPEDSYYICDTIVTSLHDELLEEQSVNMLKSMGYDEQVMEKNCKKISQIQNN
jgi:deoxyhypusine synthase